MKELLVRWWMGSVAGRYCPCEWRWKSRRLIHLCSRIDDEYERIQLREWARFVNQMYNTKTSSSSSDANVTWTVEP